MTLPKKRRRLLFLLLLLMALPVLWRVGRLLSYSPVRTNSFLWGAYHVHTAFSDGRADLKGLAQAARRNGLSFVLLTDHGSPNRESSTVNRVISGVTVLGGSEASLPEGRLAVLFPPSLPPYRLPPHPPEAVEEIRQWGGMAVITYPEDPSHLWRYHGEDLTGDGLEILNLATSFRRLSPLGKAAAVVETLISPYAFLSRVTPPTEPLALWDRLLERGKCWGFYGIDAHGQVPLLGSLNLPLPSYGSLFKLYSLGVDKRYSDSPERAIRNGDFFSLIRGAGEPRSFTFQLRQGHRILRSGESAEKPEGELEFTVQGVPSRSWQIRIFRNGRLWLQGNSETLRAPVPGPGIYRGEITLQNHPFLKRSVPWILTNPIWIATPPPPARAERPIRTLSSLSLDELRVERDEGSSAGYIFSGGQGLWNFNLRAPSRERPNRWVALSYRIPLDLSGAEGIWVEGSSQRPLRIWVELRGEGKELRGSLKIMPGLCRRLFLPFDRLFLPDGRRAGPPRVTQSLFLSINNLNVAEALSGELLLKGVGLGKREGS